jgi:hypothetical protein
MNFYTLCLCNLFKVEYGVNLLKRIKRLNCSFSKYRGNIIRDFPHESEVVAALLESFNYLYKVNVYQINLIVVKPLVR